jgi:hypothetical protein
MKPAPVNGHLKIEVKVTMANVYKVHVHYRGWGENWLIGTLASNGRQTMFQYSSEALERNVEFSPVKLKLQVYLRIAFLMDGACSSWIGFSKKTLARTHNKLIP